MNIVLIKTESHYTVDRKRVRGVVDKLLKEKGVRGNVEVSISIVGDRMMKKLNKKYRDIDKTCEILSFPLLVNNSGVFFSPAPDSMLRLGDIVISYPKARDSAGNEQKLIDDKIDELIIHGMKCLLGQNH